MTALLSHYKQYINIYSIIIVIYKQYAERREGGDARKSTELLTITRNSFALSWICRN